MKLKVSNVCQLLDKTKYQASMTKNGITCTNNDDGTFTLNGTATSRLTYVCELVVNNFIGHKLLLQGCPTGGSTSAYCLHDSIWKLVDVGNGNVYYAKNTDVNFQIVIDIFAGTVCNNLVFKPQLFDLTEMYGAGHEPTTVAEFKTKFPNDMYAYSPECWKRFKELRYRTETKNLFDISKAEITQHNGYWTSNANYTEHFYTQIVEPGKTYTVSYECHNPLAGNDALSLSVQTGNGFSDGTALYIGLIDDAKYKWIKQYREFTIPNGITQVTFSAFTETMFRNLQIEEGSTATPYQPYGYLPLRRGKYIANKEPIQLLDKSKYPATITNSGVTFTNNGDGTITLNGTNTGGSKNLYSFMFVSVKAGHYYYIYSGQEGKRENCVFTVNWSISAINADGNIGFQNKSFDICVAYLYIGAGATFNNYIVKPQFFDLTEMYGKGHEPTTVEQFRADYPNDLYEYNLLNTVSFH